MITLRPYQTAAIESVQVEFEEKSSTLVVCPTGTGKTTIFTEMVQRYLPRKSIILVHREELLTQARDRLRDQADIHCDIEMGEFKADAGLYNAAPCLVATVQTMYSGNDGKGRMDKFNPNEFSLLICDEAHHYVSPAYKRVIDYFRQNPNLKVLGVTATPDRADESALGQVFESSAYVYEILDAIHDGYLVPINQQMVYVEGLDFSNMRTTAGDLNGADLAEIMEREEVLQGVASSSIEIIGSRRTLAFTSSVKHAEMLSDIFNRYKPGMSQWVCGKTPKEERAKRLESFKRGEVQIMVNCGVLTEGFDCPQVEVIIQARPTKSRCLYAQIIGRSLRPLPGLIDKIDSPEGRKGAIAGSDKPAALVIDFVGNAGRHKLMSSADILGGKVSDEAIELALDAAKKTGKPIRMDEVLDEAEEAIKEKIEAARIAEAARRAKLVAKVNFKSVNINPFDVFDIEPARARGWDDGKVLSDKQKAVLLQAGINPDLYNYTQGKQLVGAIFHRRNNKLCSMKQASLLQRYGYDTSNMTKTQASVEIDKLKSNGWRRAA